MPSLALAQSTANNPARKLPINVVATTSMLADIVQNVGGNRLKVTALVGTGVDPHTYRQTRSDVLQLTRSDMIFWNGLNLEAQLIRLFEQLKSHKPMIALAERIPQAQRLTDPVTQQHPDPHVWMDVQLWKQVAMYARDALIEHDPAGREHYQQTASRYGEQLDQLHQRALRRLHAVPAESRVLVTAHDAFRYFGRAYGYEVLSIQGISTESEASLRQIEQLVSVLVTRKIKAVFIESSVPDQSVKALIEGAAARGHRVSIGGELFSDAMGAPGSVEGTYIGMIDHNTQTIARALGAVF